MPYTQVLTVFPSIKYVTQIGHRYDDINVADTYKH